MNPQSLFSKKLLLVTGKGGIGKSLISASLGLMAAAAGKRVCLVESGVDDQLAPLFGLPPVGHHLTEAAPGISVINLNSQDNFRDFIVLHLGMGKVFEKIFTKSIVRSFVRMIPGITEITLLGRLYYYCEEVEDPFDLVILDGWSSGHFLGLMKTPDAILNSGMVGPVIKETRKVRDFVADQSKTGIIQVTNTEELVLTECEEFLELYRKETHVHQTAVLINRLQPPPLDQGEAVDAGGSAAFARAVEFLDQRSRGSEQNLKGFLERMQARKAQYPGILVAGLNDMGAVPEPLTSDFVREWMAESREIGI